MPRTNEPAVRLILQQSGVPVTSDLTPYIDTASSIVTDHCTASGYSNEKLELIERWLGAHFYALDDPRVVQEGIATGPHQQFEFFKTDLGLDNTKYGQTAKRLDPAGNLAAFENALKEVKIGLSPAGGGASTRWVGRRPSGV